MGTEDAGMRLSEPGSVENKGGTTDKGCSFGLAGVTVVLAVESTGGHQVFILMLTLLLLLQGGVRPHPGNGAVVGGSHDLGGLSAGCGETITGCCDIAGDNKGGCTPIRFLTSGGS